MSASGIHIRIQEQDFDVGYEYREVRSRLGGQAGAIASFVGLVRDRHQGRVVDELFLEHYPGMTESSVAGIAEQACKRWALLDIVIVHRVGALRSADQIVFVQVASTHRGEAFAACEFLMDYLKTDAVLWKRERQGARARWVESTAQDRSRADDWQN